MWLFEMRYFRRFSQGASLVIISFAAACASSPESIAGDYGADAVVLRAIIGNQYADFISALNAGANPNRIFGPFHDEWAMCQATEEGREKFLYELLQRGGDPDLENVGAGTLSRRPIACAMGFRNYEAFEMLLAAGADPNAQLCDGCGFGNGWSVFQSSLSSGNYLMSVRLTEIADLSDRDHQSLVLTLGDDVHPRTSVTEKAMPALVRYLATKGIVVEVPHLHDE